MTEMFLNGPTGIKSVDVFPSQVETMLARGWTLEKPSMPKALETSLKAKDSDDGES